MLGGGKWVAQNKPLVGAYINVASVKKASSTLSDRGIATIPVELDWGKSKEVFKVTSEEFVANARKYFGYGYTHEKLKGIRDLFMNIRECYFYRLNEGTKASNTYAEALYGGTLGNELKIVITKNVDDETKYEVSTLVGTEVYETQIVSKASELVPNDYVTFKTSASLAETASTPLTGGANGEAVTVKDYEGYFNAIESFSFNAMGIPVVDTDVAKLAIAFTKRMRDDVGAKFQTVLYKQNTADYEGIISVENKVLDDDNLASLVYYTTGIIAGCAINKSNTNQKYKGEYQVDTKYTQAELAEALESGKFIYHRVADEVRVLEDINTFVSFTEDKNADFAQNQTIRVADQVANDIAVLFNDRYLGKMPNNANGRVALWNDIVKHHTELERMQAIENFDSDKVVVEQGADKRSVLVTDEFTVVNAMHRLYMTVYIS